MVRVCVLILVHIDIESVLFGTISVYLNGDCGVGILLHHKLFCCTCQVLNIDCTRVWHSPLGIIATSL